MTAATFGDILAAARRHLDAATGLTGSIADRESITAAAAMTGRLAMTLSRYLADVAPYDMAEVITNGELSAQMRAAVQAREALQLAAEGLRTATRDQDSPGPEPAGPLAAHLAAAAAALAAGRDLLRTHATTGPDGHWEPRSRWATVIGSGPVSQGAGSRGSPMFQAAHPPHGLAVRGRPGGRRAPRHPSGRGWPPRARYC